MYPNFAEFAARSTWYRNATGIGGWTPHALPAMLSGRYWWGSQVCRSEHQQLSGQLVHPVRALLQPRGLRDGHRALPSRQVRSDRVPDSAFTDLAEETAKVYKSIVWPIETPIDPDATAVDKDGPTAYFDNLKYYQPDRVDIRAFDQLLGPSRPCASSCSCRTRLGGICRMGGSTTPSLPIPERPRGVWPDAIQSVQHQRHLLQVAYTDKLLGTVIDRLKRQGLWDVSGRAHRRPRRGFTPGGGCSTSNAADLMWVPMLLKAPGQTQGRVDRNWEHVDLVPTLADMVGLTVPWQVDGFAQNGPPRRQRTDKVFHNSPGQPLVRPGPNLKRSSTG